MASEPVPFRSEPFNAFANVVPDFADDLKGFSFGVFEEGQSSFLRPGT
jgi:hypothetical protein